ncbi:MAG TPA: DUF2938 domain-containing protein [Burkholderiales bacterium]|nr:DUF2938 domain-containing protein [Burkholderiales bacterium]
MEISMWTLLVGIGATAIMDLWGIARKKLFGMPSPNYGLVGRWLAHMPSGRFRHESITKASVMRGESLIGWTAHYLTGVAFAAILVCIWGADWIHQPKIGPALLVGIGTLAAPFLLMQPGMGQGLAARRAPRPWTARFHSFVTHTVFGLGLYASAWAAKGLHCFWYSV